MGAKVCIAMILAFWAALAPEAGAPQREDWMTAGDCTLAAGWHEVSAVTATAAANSTPATFSSLRMPRSAAACL